MVAVLAAYHGNNPGMLSTNLALIQLLAPERSDAVFLNLEVNADRFDGVLRYRNAMAAPALLDGPMVIGWGDFIHCIGWARNELAAQVAQRGAAAPEAVVEAWYRVYMLEGANIDRVLSFGSTLYINRLSSYLEPRYRAALSSLSDRARLFAFRDPISVSQLHNALGPSAELGCDCAFLLDSGPLIQGLHLPQELVPGRYIVAGFARSWMAAEQMTLANALAKQMGMPVVSVRWLAMKNDQEFRMALAILRNAALCVSDVYHACVSGLREGVPVLCVTRAGDGSRTLDDEKKRILFLSLGLGDWLVDLDELVAIKRPRLYGELVAELVDRVGLDSAGALLRSGLHPMIDRWRSRLRAELTSA